MKTIQNIKEELQQGIEKLPEHKIPEVLLSRCKFASGEDVVAFLSLRGGEKTN